MSTVVIKKRNFLDIMVALVIISSIALRNYKYLLYGIQGAFLLCYGPALLKRVYKPYVLVNGLFVFLACSSVLWASEPSYVFQKIPSIVQIYILCSVITGYVINVDRIDRVITMFIIASVVLIINLFFTTPLSEWQNVFLFGLGENVDVSSSAGRLGPTIGMHPNEFGEALAVCIMCCFYRFYTTHRWRYLLWDFVLLVFLMLSKSRASLLEGMLGIGLIYILGERSQVKKTLILGVCFLAGIASLWAMINVPVLYNAVGYRIEGLLNLFSSSSQADASTLTRLNFIVIAFKLFLRSPLVGIGLYNYPIVAYEDFSIWGKVSAHCNFAEILADLGIIGFLPYYSLFFYAVLRLYKIAKVTVHHKNQCRFRLASFLLALAFVIIIDDVSHLTFDVECIHYALVLIVVGSSVLSRKRVMVKTSPSN